MIRLVRRALRRLQTIMLPYWLSAPLALLGAFFLVFVPFGIDWSDYAAALVIAAAFGWYMRRRWAVTVLERTDKGAVYCVRKRPRKGETEEPPAYTAPSDLTG
jgi:prepilin signal peptidase PulO-like enzyme (type II secretory pathway)